MTSVLSRSYRQPKVYIPLPSKGEYFYEENFFGDGLSVNKEVPILAMRAKDELLLKNPDALLNGSATIEIIKSCCPFIKDPKKLLTVDTEIIMLGIMEASYGNSLGLNEKCAKCGNFVEKKIQISHLLDNQNFNVLEKEYVIEEEINGNKNKFFVRPSNNEDFINSMLALLEEERMKVSIQGSDLKDEEKMKRFSESFKKIALNNFDFVVSHIERIEVTYKDDEGNLQTGTESSKEEIHKFIFEEIDRAIANKIEKLVSEINQVGLDKKVTITCDNKIKDEEDNVEVCGHEWESETEFNPTTFFGAGCES